MRKTLVALVFGITLLFCGCGEPANTQEDLDGLKGVVLTVQQSSLDLFVGETKEISFSVSPANSLVDFSSSDENVARVEDGVIKALNEGEAKIILTANTETEEILVEVHKKEVNFTVPTELYSGLKPDNTYFDYDIEITSNFKIEKIFLSDNIIVNSEENTQNLKKLNISIKYGDEIKFKVEENGEIFEQTYPCQELKQFYYNFYQNNEEIIIEEKINLYLIDENYENIAAENNIFSSFSIETNGIISLSGESVTLEEGVIRAKEEGKATLKISSNDIFDQMVELTIEVLSVKAQTLDLDMSPRELEIGASFTLEPTALPVYAIRKEVSFLVSGDSISIEGNVVTAEAGGEAKVLVYLNGELYGEITVTVKEPEPPEPDYSLTFKNLSNVSLSGDGLVATLNSGFLAISFEVALCQDGVETTAQFTLKSYTASNVLSASCAFNNLSLFVIAPGEIEIVLTNGTSDFAFTILVV